MGECGRRATSVAARRPRWRILSRGEVRIDEEQEKVIRCVVVVVVVEARARARVVRIELGVSRARAFISPPHIALKQPAQSALDATLPCFPNLVPRARASVIASSSDDDGKSSRCAMAPFAGPMATKALANDDGRDDRGTCVW